MGFIERLPMLIDDQCSVYNVRPTSCAAYYSKSKAACKILYDNPNDMIPKTLGIYDLARRTTLEREIANKVVCGKNHDNTKYEIVTSLAKLFSNPALIRKWPKKTYSNLLKCSFYW